MMATPFKQYEALMNVVRQRLDSIMVIKKANLEAFSKAETAAFHGRKVVEGIAFGCLIAVENGIKHVPRDAKGQWNASKIFQSLNSKQIKTVPNPSTIREASEKEKKEHNVKVTIEGTPELCLTYNELTAIYERLHKWLHEINPYVEEDRAEFIAKNEETLWEDLSKLHNLVERHVITIKGEGFYCTLRDSQDGLTKVISLSKVQSIM